MKASASQTYPPGLYLVATPIGNLRDISLRALDVLQAADLIACEDTRVTAKLLNHYGIKKPTLSYNDHNGAERRPQILQALSDGKRVALVSDAGTPLISDPGYKLAKEARDKGFTVTALPGASSLLVALSVSALPTDRFFFAGFLSAKAEARKKEIRALAAIPSTLVFFESNHRLTESLTALAEGLGGREVTVARELTKLHEETRHGTLTDLAAHYAKAGEPKGEVVIVVGPPQAHVTADEDIETQLQFLLKSHSVKEAASVLAEQTGRPRKEIYALALKVTNAQR